MKTFLLFMAACFLYINACLAQSKPAETRQTKLTPDLLSIVVKDVSKAAEWYEQMLGFRIYKKMDLPAYDSLKIYFLTKDNFNLELVEKRKAVERGKYSSFESPLLQGFNKVSFRVTNIHAYAKGLEGKKVVFKTKVFHDNAFRLTSFIVEDIEGNLIQFVEYDK